jgi:hypothetical protein
MAFNQLSATHKTWDHVGNIVPNVEYSEPHRPHGEYLVADWLPVTRLDKYFEEYWTVSAGKVVAFDRQGRVVPAGLKTAFAVTSGDVLTYAATTDNAEGVIDLGTGATVIAAGNGYTRTELTAALLDRGLLDAGENAEDFISFPVGVAPYSYVKWAGGDGSNPAELVKHNFMLQHRVAILCKYVVEMSLVPASGGSADLSDVTAISDSAIADWSPSAKPALFSSTALSLTQRYAARVTAGDDVMAIVLQQLHVAKNLTLTPVVFPSATVFARERTTIAELTQVGDYMWDLEVGVILMYEADGNAAPAGADTGSITYYHYDSVPTSVSTYGCAVGDLRPGDFVRADANSNFVKAQVIVDTDVETVTSEDPETSLTSVELAGLLNLCAKRQDEIIGQVLDVEIHPRDYLDRVRTAYPQLGTADQMPGTASGGLPTQVTYAGASNRMIRILLLK